MKYARWRWNKCHLQQVIQSFQGQKFSKNFGINWHILAVKAVPAYYLPNTNWWKYFSIIAEFSGMKSFSQNTSNHENLRGFIILKKNRLIPASRTLQTNKHFTPPTPLIAIPTTKTLSTATKSETEVDGKKTIRKLNILNTGPPIAVTSILLKYQVTRKKP